MSPELKEILFNIFADMGKVLLGEEIDDFETELNKQGFEIKKIDDVPLTPFEHCPGTERKKCYEPIKSK